MIASEVPEAKFQQHLNTATKESLSLPLTWATQKQSVEKMVRNYLRIKYMHQCIFLYDDFALLSCRNVL